MIDAQDKSTQALPLDEMPIKRKRGRPSTGKAMTPAEKQRAYRERQKELRDQNSGQAAPNQDGMWMTKEALESLTERQLQLSKELSEHVKRANKAEAKAEECRLIAVEISERCKAAEDRVAELEKELKLRDRKEKKGNVTSIEAPGTGVWTVHFKLKGSRAWTECEPQVDFEGVPWAFEATKQHVDDMARMSTGSSWRAVRDDGLIYEAKQAPRVKRHRDQPAAELIDKDE